MLDTLVEITVASRNEQEAHKAMSAAYEEIQRIETLLSRYYTESQIYKVNQLAGEEAVGVDLEVAEIVRRSLRYAELTDGAFDITIGPVIDLWGIGTEHERVPEDLELRHILQYVDYRKIDIRGEQEIRLREPGMKLDVGGIAKGYAVDRAIDVLQHHNITSVLLNAGGDIRCIGTKPDGTPWRIGIQDPRKGSEILGIVPLQDVAIATSGDYERFFFQDTIRFHHIFSPHTGIPARGCQSVTILAKRAEVADVFATAAFIMGPQRGLKFIEERPDIEGMIIRSDGEILTSSGFSFEPVN
jgi:thiamine biosynthesis lipoprotein